MVFKNVLYKLKRKKRTENTEKEIKLRKKINLAIFGNTRTHVVQQTAVSSISSNEMKIVRSRHPAAPECWIVVSIPAGTNYYSKTFNYYSFPYGICRKRLWCYMRRLLFYSFSLLGLGILEINLVINKWVYTSIVKECESTLRICVFRVV